MKHSSQIVGLMRHVIASSNELSLFMMCFMAALVPCESFGQLMTVREEMNSHVMLETLAHSYFSIQQEFGADTASSVGFNGTYSEAGWGATMSGNIYGQPMQLQFNGTMSGELGSDIRVDFTAAGYMGGPVGPGEFTVDIVGQSLWTYDSVAMTYPTMIFEDQGTVDTPKLKWWVIATEVILGGTAGGLLAGPGGIIGGASLGLNCSNASQSNAINAGDPTQPNPPEALNVADLNELANFQPGPTQILTRISGSGELFANVYGSAFLTGTWNNGSFSGNGLTVPEPTTVSTATLGILVLLLAGRRRVFRIVK